MAEEIKVNAANVTAGKPKIGGAVYRAPVNTALPTDAKTALNDAFVSMGYVSEEGLTNANGPETDSKKAWGGDTVLNYQTGKADTFKFKLIEAMNANVLKAVYGDSNVTGSLEAGLTVKANSTEPDRAAWVFDMILKGNVAKRIVLPCASMTELEDIVYTDNDAVGYGITLGAEPDAAGNTHYEYIIKNT